MNDFLMMNTDICPEFVELADRHTKSLHVADKVKKTFCFTDIKGSTRIAARLGEAYAFILERYRSLVREAVSRYRGTIIDNPGDGFFIVFDNAFDAVNAARDMQLSFHSESWQDNVEVMVRIGIHTGEGVLDAGGYTGVAVHKTARICDAARGGQTLVSSAVKTELGEMLPGDLDIKELGKFDLRDIEQVSSLYQLIIPGIINEFPPPRAISVVPVVAVMPFRNLSDNSEDDYFCEGMSVEIMHALARHPGIRVVSMSSVFALKGEQDARDIGQKLNAVAILEGVLSKDVNQVKINVELVESASGVTLWTDSFDGNLDEIWSFQDKIADKVSEILEDTPVQTTIRPIQTIQTHNIEAYDFYLRGKKFYAQFSRQGVEFAKQMFNKAIAEDPNYALAYSGLAECYAYQFMFDAHIPEHLEAAEKASLKAIELDPNLAEAHASRGLVLYLSKRYDAAEASFEKAISLDPKLYEAYYNYGRVCFAEGKLDRAGGLFREANRVRPDDYQSLLLAGQCFSDIGLHARAEEMRREGVEIVRSYLELNPGDTRALYMGANGLVALGNNKEGLEWLQRALTLEPKDPMLLYNAGCIYAMVGMHEEALTTLEYAFKFGLTQIEWYLHDSNLDPLRQDQRFQELIHQLKERIVKTGS